MRWLSPLLLAAALVAAPVTAAGAADDPARPKQWALDRIGGDAARQVADGRGVIVAVIDSGVDLQHEDLVAQLVPGHDFVEDDGVPQDAFGHGTHVAGIIAATAGNGKGVAGVAPGAKVMPIRVLDADGAGTLDDVIAGIRWAVDHGAKVINLSLGEDTQAILGPSFGAAVEDAWKAGVVPVVSAGNQFLTGSGFRDEPAIVVSATNREDGKPTYSSGTGSARWGMAAPGGEVPDLGVDGAILSTYWTGDGPNKYAYLAGTSQAAPQVAGAVAVLLSTGKFTPQQAVDRVLGTAADIGPRGKDGTFGAGRLDLAAATRGVTAGPPKPAAPAPAAPPAPAPAPAPGPAVTPPPPPAFVPPPTVVPGSTTPVVPPLAPDVTPTVTSALPEIGTSQKVAAPARGEPSVLRRLPEKDSSEGVEGPAPWIAAALALAAGAGSIVLRRRQQRS